MESRREFSGGTVQVTFASLAATVVILLFFSTIASASIVYSQTPTASGIFFGDGKALASISADDFVLTSAATVDKVTWQGAMNFPVAPPNVTDNFTINFYQNGVSGPGSLIATFAVGNATRVDTGIDIDVGGSFSRLFEHTTK